MAKSRAQLDILNTELTTDPLTRGYSGMNDAAAAADLNTVYREAAAPAVEILKYCLLEKNQTGEGGDTTATFIWGRVETVANAAVGSDPFGRGGGTSLSREQSDAAKAFRRILDNDLTIAESFLDSRIDNMLTVMRQTGIIKPVDKTALQNLSANQQSRANELGLGKVSEGEVTKARAL